MNYFSCTHKPVALALISSAVLSASPAISQEPSFNGIEEVIVTAQKRSESLQDVPIAVSALSADSIENLGISDAKDLGAAIPSLQTPAFPTSNNNLGFFIRGVGNADSNILTRDNSVGIYIDGVYQGRTTGLLADLVDLERIEVLRGPQGTLYGRNTTAGAVNFVSAKPTGGFSVKQQVSVGNFDYWRSRTTVNLPDAGGLKTKISYIASDRDGWVENKGPNKLPDIAYEDFNQNKQQGVRLVMSWDISDQLALDYAYDYTDMETTPPYHQYDGPVFGNITRTFSKRLEDTRNAATGLSHAYPLSLSDTVSQGHSLILSWGINDSLSFKSITGFRDLDSDQFTNFGDTFASPAIPVLFFGGGVFGFTTDLLIDNEQFTQEFQFVGHTESVQYVAGIYYLDEDGSYTENQINFFGFPLDLGTYKVDSEVESVAAYGQATWSMSERLELTLGLRHTKDDRSAKRAILDPAFGGFTAGANDGDFSKTDYSVTANFFWNEDISTYIKYATGFRSGGSSPRALDFSITYDEETLNSIEIGLKSQLLDNRLRLNAAVFHSSYDDVILDFEKATDPGKTVGVNAGEGDIDGVELEVLYMPAANLQLGLNYTYLNAEITKVTTPPAPLDPITNFEFLWAPEHAYSVTMDYSFDPFSFGALSLHLNYAWQDDQFATAPTDASKDITNDFGQLNGRITLDQIQLGDASLKFALWGKNLTDEEDPTYNLVGTAKTHMEPRRYGLDVTIEF